MMITWYRVSSWRNKIEPVEIEKSTDKTVWINGRRQSIVSTYERFFPTEREAAVYVREILVRSINRLKEALRVEQNNLDALNQKYGR